MADVFGNQGQFTAGDISNFIAQNINNPQAIANAAQQYGITPTQIQQAAGYTPTQQAEYLGGSGIAALQPLTVQQLYTDVLGRAPDPSGAQYWAEKFGSTIDPSEIQAFKAAAAPELASKAYETVLGRTGEQTGLDYWTQQLQSGAVSPEDLKQNLAYAAQGMDRPAAQTYLGKEVWAPTDYLKGTSGMGYQDIINYINQNISDPTKIYQASAKYGVDPNEILQAYQSQGQSPYSLQQIQDYLTQGKTGFGNRYQDILESTVGTSSLGATDYLTQFETNRKNIERNLGLKPDTLKSTYNVSDFTNKSLEDIEQMLQQSGANKYQESLNLSNLAKNVYGMTDEQAKALRSGLLKDGDVDPKAKEFYNQLLKTGLTKDLEEQILMDAAVRAPQSKYWQDNPGLREAYTPIEKLESRSEGGNQYGLDPRTNLPFLSLKAVNDKVLDDRVLRKSNVYDYQDLTGADPHSKYQGLIAKGVGMFGVDATNKQISDFDKIEKEIAKLGGVKTETTYDEYGTPITRQVVYKDAVDPETGEKYKQAVDIKSLFPDDEFSGLGGYQIYTETQNKLREAARSVGADINQYKNIKDAFDDLNKRLEGKYIWQGRTDVLDPAAAATLGIPDVKDNAKHATILYQEQGDKLVPVKVLKTFDFKDPKTSMGFFREISPFLMAALAMGGGLSSLFTAVPEAAIEYGAAPGLFGSTFGTPYAAGAGATLAADIGAGLGLEGAAADIAGRALLQAGTSGLMTGLRGGNLEDMGIAALAGGVGAGVSGGLPMALKGIDISPGALKLGSELAGGAAATAITGQDPGKYAVNRLIATGIGALTSMGAEKAGIPTKGPGANVFKAMMPIITTKKVSPNDVVRLAQAIDAYQKAAQG